MLAAHALRKVSVGGQLHNPTLGSKPARSGDDRSDFQKPGDTFCLRSQAAWRVSMLLSHHWSSTCTSDVLARSQLLSTEVLVTVGCIFSTPSTWTKTLPFAVGYQPAECSIRRRGQPRTYSSRRGRAGPKKLKTCLTCLDSSLRSLTGRFRSQLSSKAEFISFARQSGGIKQSTPEMSGLK